MLWHCWLGIRKRIWPVKMEWWGAGMMQMICMWSSWCNCHTIHCFIKIHIGLTFLVPAYSDCPGKEAIKWASINVCYKMEYWKILTLQFIWMPLRMQHCETQQITHQKPQNHKKVILPTITLPKCQSAAEYCHIFTIFAVFNVQYDKCLAISWEVLILIWSKFANATDYNWRCNTGLARLCSLWQWMCPALA